MTTTEIDMSDAWPGICRTHPSFCQGLMSYRVETEPANRHSHTVIRGTVIRGGACHPKLEVPLLKNSNGEEIVEDCRLFLHQGRPWFSVTNREVIGVGPVFDPIKMNWLPKLNDCVQKNWMFFDHDGELMAVDILSDQDHNVVVVEGDKVKDNMYFTDVHFPWYYGKISGGTSPIRYGNLYFSFFHSHIEGQVVRETPTRHPSDVALNPDNKRRIYYAAPYAFSAAPPFKVVLAPKRPMIWPRIYSAGDLAPNGHDVVFPCSLEIEGDSWRVAWGDDERCWLSTFSTKEIFDNLYAP